MRPRRSWCLVLAVLTLAGLPAPASAQAIGSEFQVNTYTTGYQRADGGRAIAADANGNFVVVWSSYDQGGLLNRWDVFARRYDSEGNPLGREFRVNTYTSQHQRSPSVAVAVDGDFVFVWGSVYQYGNHEGIFGQRYDGAGGPLGREFRVNSTTEGTQSMPAVSSDAAGNFVVVWHGLPGDGSRTAILAQRYDSAGVALGGEFRVNSATTGAQGYPSIASDAIGNFVVVWHSNNLQYSDIDVFGQRYDSAGDPLGSEFRVNTYTTNTQFLPSIASDASGNFVVVWSSRGDVFGQRYDSAGGALGIEFRVNSYTTALQFEPSVAFDASGNFVVAWSSSGPNGQDGQFGGVFGQRYDSAGRAQGGEFQVNSYTTNNQAEPAVASDASGSFVVTWNSVYQDGSETGVFGRRFADGSRQDRADGFAAEDPEARARPELDVRDRARPQRRRQPSPRAPSVDRRPRRRGSRLLAVASPHRRAAAERAARRGGSGRT